MNQYTEQQTQHRLILCTHLKYHSRFLQQICSHVGTDDTVTVVKADLDVFPKATAVVISGGLCISDGLGKRRQTQPTIITKCVFRRGYADNHNWSVHCKCKESVHLDSGRTPIMCSEFDWVDIRAARKHKKRKYTAEWTVIFTVVRTGKNTFILQPGEPSTRCKVYLL